MADETPAAEAPQIDSRTVAMYSIHLPKEGPGSARRMLILPSGAKKPMDRLQTDKEADDYPHVKARISHAQAADLASNGYELRLLKADPADETKTEATDMRARAAKAKKPGE